jgi:hypothetical protein
MTEHDCRTIVLSPCSPTHAGLRPLVACAPSLPGFACGERRAPHAGISGSPCKARRSPKGEAGEASERSERGGHAVLTFDRSLH